MLWTTLYKILFKYILYPNIGNPASSFWVSHKIDTEPFFKFNRFLFKFSGGEGKFASSILKEKLLSIFCRILKSMTFACCYSWKSIF